MCVCVCVTNAIQCFIENLPLFVCENGGTLSYALVYVPVKVSLVCRPMNWRLVFY